LTKENGRQIKYLEKIPVAARTGNSSRLTGNYTGNVGLEMMIGTDPTDGGSPTAKVGPL
jgi:hypothetical protein